MSRKGPIIIIEDDVDDQYILEAVFLQLALRNERKFFSRCEDAFQYLMSTSDKPFIILSDVNLPGMTGTELRRQINESDLLRKKSIPFIFFTTYAQKEVVEKAYEMMVQGYFEKPASVDELKSMLEAIIKYWQLCKHPNSE